ncbi:DNA translocase FtsK [Bacillus sp. H-16]|uniref:DNA translocase FtsK n=1 Tax=Alteribacter salitolerans TaxID=2912333 RepID=UPI001962FE40|nr:DNA translocase FtsK [Alteribacter salitolerans]MBM7096398.1 DNA translocase FtsK [Alteribacter salitolerans]
MGFNFQKWIGEVKGLFSVDDEGIEPKKTTSEPKGKSSKPSFRKNTNSLPLNKGEEAKIIHQYPKTGAFRFPVVKDDEPLGKDVHNDQSEKKRPSTKSRRVSHEENQQTKSTGKKPVKREQKIQQPEPDAKSKKLFQGTISNHSKTPEGKTKFGGRDFSVRQIPSPIFGFGEREEETLQKYREDVLNEFLRLEGLEPKDTRKESIEEMEKETGLDHETISNVLTEAEQAEIIDSEEPGPRGTNSLESEEEIIEEPSLKQPGATEENDEVYEDKMTASHSGEEPESAEQDTSRLITEEVAEKPEEDIHEGTFTTPSEDIGHDQSEERDMRVETPVTVNEDKDFSAPSSSARAVQAEADNQPVLDEDEDIHEEPMENTDLPSSDDFSRETTDDYTSEAAASVEVIEQKPIEQAPQTQRAVAEKPARKEQRTNQPSQVPFNVLMFQRDRVKHERKEKQNRGKGGLPELHLLEVPPKRSEEDDQELTAQSTLLNQTLEYFNVRAKVVNVTRGPSVTRFEVHPEPGVKVSKITNLQDDIKLSLAAKDIRMEAPIPGKNTIGIEVPNRKSDPVFLRDILKSRSYIQSESPLTAALGVDIAGQPIVTDLQKMPHGLIAGATGSGKSVCVNAILLSLLYKASPKEVRFLLIDPKMVELAPYNGIPHLAAPVITDSKEATQALKWAVEEMERRYERFAETGSRDLTRYNKKMREQGKEGQVFPYLVVVVDELADLMMVSPQDVEEAICRIAQKARACGIHLLVATQRPSVDVITGLIKANIPTRIAFSVSAQTDSRTILDASGAEKLLGRGDMLFLGNGESKSVRLQGAFVSDDEIERVTEHVKKSGPPRFLFEREELQAQEAHDADDPMFEEVCRFIIDQQAASSSLLQRRFRMGFNRAARLIDMLEERGIISPSKGSKPRDVYLTHEELDENFVEKG